MRIFLIWALLSSVVFGASEEDKKKQTECREVFLDQSQRCLANYDFVLLRMYQYQSPDRNMDKRRAEWTEKFSAYVLKGEKDPGKINLWNLEQRPATLLEGCYRFLAAKYFYCKQQTS